jgi:STE24 endopeptidase
MTPAKFTIVFLVALGASLALRLWLARRHWRHVEAHRDAVPAAFAGRIGLAAHRKAAAYTIARTRFEMLATGFNALLLLALTLGGGLSALVVWTDGLALPLMLRDLSFIVLVALALAVTSLPFAWWTTFRIEAAHGFNRTTPGTWFADLAKVAVLAAALGLPLAALTLWLMRAAGPAWWLWVWAAWMTFQVLLLVLYPSVIAPLFNKFTPLPAGTARDRVEALLARCGFASRGLYVMDGSRRSAHGNAYFTGFGRAKRIVFFDTLLDKLGGDELEAVLAHELGHFKRRHVAKQIAVGAGLSLVWLALLAWLLDAGWFYLGLGVRPAPDRPGVALTLFFLVLPVFTFLLGPVMSLLSRRHEFEADAFAAAHASGPALVSALVKLYEDNAATLTPDPLHSAFYDSHPPAAVRVARLEAPGGPLPPTAPARA